MPSESRFGEGLRPLPRSSGGLAGAIPPEAWQGPQHGSPPMGLGGRRNEGLPLEAWTGTMASEPKGLSPGKRRAAEHKRKAKSSSATNNSEEWQSPKEEAKQQS